MDFKVFRHQDTSSIEVQMSHMVKDLDAQTTVEIIAKIRERLIKECANEIVKQHFQEIVSSIDVKSLVNAVYIQSAKKIAKELNN